MKIYTKTGDKGKTRLVGGECVDKNNPRVECYGTVDELNSHLGLSLCQITKEPSLQALGTEILRIQHELFNLGSLLACEDALQLPRLPQINKERILQLENSIDAMTETLAPLKNFILPGGSEISAQLHIARTVCRRTERHTVELIGLLRDALSAAETDCLEHCLVYLNRLSDYLFVAARFANQKQGRFDQIWQK